jgi:hypothetical protein
MGDVPNKNSDPLETIIDFAWSAGADRFWVNNAKDELKNLRNLLNSINNKNPVAYARTNSVGDLFDLRLQNNPYIDQSTVVPLFRLDE